MQQPYEDHISAFQKEPIVVVRYWDDEQQCELTSHGVGLHSLRGYVLPPDARGVTCRKTGHELIHRIPWRSR